MIPVRIRLKNFLTYDTDEHGGPVVFDFDGASLWSISGDNGAGKTAIFDGITYALFGQHRGGRQGDGRLIRQGAVTAEVAFEFRQGDRLYQARRTVTRRRTRAGQVREVKELQAAVWEPGDQAWRTLPDTDRDHGFSRWARERLGMSADTFCASILLQQGNADRLLTETPAQRFQILAGLVDLSAYQQLEEAVLNRRRAADIEIVTYERQLAALPEVTEAELAQAKTAFNETETEVERLASQQADVERRAEGARSFAALQHQRHQLTTQLEGLAELLGQAERIHADHNERQTLLSALDPIQKATADLDAARQAEAQAATAETELLAIDIDALEATLHTTTHAATDAEQRRDQAQQHAAGLADLMPSLRRLHACRLELADRSKAAAEAGEPAARASEVDQLQTALKEAEEASKAAEADAEAALGAYATARSRRDQAREHLALREEVREEGTCSRCGQVVDHQHLARELSDAQAGLAQAEQHLGTAKQQADESIATRNERRTKVRELSEALGTARLVAIRATAAAAEEARAQSSFATARAQATNVPPAWLAPLLTADLPTATAVLATAEQEHQEAAANATLLGTAAEEAKGHRQAAADELAAARHRQDLLQGEQQRLCQQAGGWRREAAARLQGIAPALHDEVLAGTPGVVERVRARCDALAGSDERYAALVEAESQKVKLTARLDGIDELLDAVPIEHRVDPTVAEHDREAAAKLAADARSARDRARDHHQHLRDRQKQQQEAAGRLAVASQRRRLAHRLYGLVGRSGLQAALLADATTGIQALANDTLAHISGGQLAVSLQTSQSSTDSLEILVTDLTSADEPIEASFLSGSQKFRVAVALAAGIGQYAGGPTAIRSLIIDEGFGSLDETGREGMITELRGLAEHLERVIVVSHQPDFSDRILFPSGFVLRKVGRRTMVERVT